MRKPNGVEPDLLQERERFSAVLDRPRQDRPIVDHEDGIDEANPSRGQLLRVATRVGRGDRSGDGRNERGSLCRIGSDRLLRSREPDVAGNVEIVDPDVGHPRPAVNVQQQTLDVRAAGIDAGAKLERRAQVCRLIAWGMSSILNCCQRPTVL